MIKKYRLIVVDKNDPNLKLKQLDGKGIGEFSFDSSTISLEEKLDNKFLKKMNKFFGNEKNLSLTEKLYSAVYKKAEEKKANIAVIEEKNEDSIKASLYSVPGINLYHPTQLFEGGFGINSVSNKYSLAKSLEYSSVKNPFI